MTLITDFSGLKKNSAITSCTKIETIMMPLLKKHGITIFSFYREFLNGSFIRLSTHQSWTEHFFKKQYWNKTDKTPTDYFEKPLNYFLWIKEDYPEMLIDAEMNFNISNGITISFCYDEHFDSFGFGTTRSNTSIVNRFYLNNLDALTNYCHYFREKAASIILHAEKEKILLHNPTQCQKKSIQFPHIQLSNREYECAKLLIKGMK